MSLLGYADCDASMRRSFSFGRRLVGFCGRFRSIRRNWSFGVDANRRAAFASSTVTMREAVKYLARKGAYASCSKNQTIGSKGRSRYGETSECSVSSWRTS